MPDHAILGRLTIDYVVTADDRVHEGLLGGGLAYSAAGARVWSSSVGLFGRIGEDFPAPALDSLRGHGFDLSGVQRVDRRLQHTAFFAYQKVTERLNGNPASHFLRIGSALPKALLGLEARTPLSNDDSLDAYAGHIAPVIDSCKAAHLAPVSWRKASLLTSKLRERGITMITLDPHSGYLQPGEHEQLKVLLRDVDAFLPSLRQARRLFQRPEVDPWSIAENFADWGPRFVVLKCGKTGQMVYDAARGRRWQVPAYPVTALDVTGAGHSFCGGFLAGLSATGDPLEAALWGNVSASLTVEGTGPLYPLESLPRLAEARLERLRAHWKEL